MSQPVLCRLPNHVGDCVMTLPALRLLAESGYAPSLVGKRFAEDLMLGMGWRFDPIVGKVTEDLSRMHALAAEFPGRHPLGLLFPNSIGSALLFRTAGVRSAGFPTDGRRLFLDKSVPEPGPMHEVERFFTAAREAIIAWGGTPVRDKPEKELGLKLLARHRAGARNILKDHEIHGPFVLLAPVAKGLHHGQVKCWQHFNALAKFIRSQGVIPLALPSPDEVEDVKKACPDALILPPTTLGTYAALCELAAAVVANDSGVSHVAAGVGARQVTLIGVTDTDRTGPWNPKALVLGRNGAWPSEEEVFEAVRGLIDQAKRESAA